MSSGWQTHAVAREGVDREKLYPIEDAVKLVKERAKAKSTRRSEVAMKSRRRSGAMPIRCTRLRQPAERLRPLGVAWRCSRRGGQADEAKAAGADGVRRRGSLVEKVQGGSIDLDRVVATPDLMPRSSAVSAIWCSARRVDAPTPGRHRDRWTSPRGSRVPRAARSSFPRRESRHRSSRAAGKGSFSAGRSWSRTSRRLQDAVQKSRPAGAKGHFIHRRGDLGRPIERPGGEGSSRGASSRARSSRTDVYRARTQAWRSRLYRRPPRFNGTLLGLATFY